MLRAQIATDELVLACSRLAGIVAGKATVPQCESVLVEACKLPDGGRLRFTANDLEIGAVTTHPAEVFAEGTVCVSAKLLREVAARLAENVAALRELPNGWLEISSGAGCFELAGREVDEFAAVEIPEADALYDYDPAVLVDALDGVRFAMSTDETRYNLNGAQLELRREGLVAVATDGHRLAVQRRGEWQDLLFCPVLVPRKGVLALRKALDLVVHGRVELGVSERALTVTCPGLAMAIRLIDGVFPDWSQIIPRDTVADVNLPRRRLVEVLDRARVIASGHGEAVELRVLHNELRVRSESPAVGTVVETVVIEFDREPFFVSVNAAFLVDALKASAGDVVRLCFGGAHAPVFLHAHVDEDGEDDERELHLVMPLNVGEAAAHAKPSDASEFH